MSLTATYVADDIGVETKLLVRPGARSLTLIDSTITLSTPSIGDDLLKTRAQVLELIGNWPERIGVLPQYREAFVDEVVEAFRALPEIYYNEPYLESPRIFFHVSNIGFGTCFVTGNDPTDREVVHLKAAGSPLCLLSEAPELASLRHLYRRSDGTCRILELEARRRPDGEVFDSVRRYISSKTADGRFIEECVTAAKNFRESQRDQAPQSARILSRFDDDTGDEEVFVQIHGGFADQTDTVIVDPLRNVDQEVPSERYVGARSNDLTRRIEDMASVDLLPTWESDDILLEPSARRFVEQCTLQGWYDLGYLENLLRSKAAALNERYSDYQDVMGYFPLVADGIQQFDKLIDRAVHAHRELTGLERLRPEYSAVSPISQVETILAETYRSLKFETGKPLCSLSAATAQVIRLADAIGVLRVVALSVGLKHRVFGLPELSPGETAEGAVRNITDLTDQLDIVYTKPTVPCPIAPQPIVALLDIVMQAEGQKVAGSKDQPERKHLIGFSLVTGHITDQRDSASGASEVCIDHVAPHMAAQFLLDELLPRITELNEQFRLASSGDIPAQAWPAQAEVLNELWNLLTKYRIVFKLFDVSLTDDDAGSHERLASLVDDHDSNTVWAVLNTNYQALVTQLSDPSLSGLDEIKRRARGFVSALDMLVAIGKVALFLVEKDPEVLRMSAASAAGTLEYLREKYSTVKVDCPTVESKDVMGAQVSVIALQWITNFKYANNTGRIAIYPLNDLWCIDSLDSGPGFLSTHTGRCCTDEEFAARFAGVSSRVGGGTGNRVVQSLSYALGGATRTSDGQSANFHTIYLVPVLVPAKQQSGSHLICHTPCISNRAGWEAVEEQKW